MSNQRGSSTVEVVILAPALVFVAMLVVSSFRFYATSARLSAAADAAARAASMVSRGRMTHAAEEVIGAYLSDVRPLCSGLRTSVGTSSNDGVETVDVRLTCRLSDRGLGLPRGRTIRVVSSEVVDVYTYR